MTLKPSPHLGTRLKCEREKLKLTQADVARRAGVSQGLIAQIESGTNEGSKHVVKIANALGVSSDWLVYGAGESQPEHVMPWNSRDDLPPDDSRVWVDRWDYAFSAGNGSVQWEVRKKDALPFSGGLFSSIGCKPEQCRLLVVQGDSMEPFLFDRDMIMIDVTKTDLRDGRIYAIHFEGEALVKQVFKQAGGALTLHSFNNRYPDRHVNPEDMETLAIAGEVVYRSGSGFI